MWKRINEEQEQRRFVLKDESCSMFITREIDADSKYLFTVDIDHYKTNGGSFTRMSLDAHVDMKRLDDEVFVINLACDLFQRAFLSRNIGEYYSEGSFKSSDFGGGVKGQCPNCDSELLVRVTDDDDDVLFGKCSDKKCGFEVNLEDDAIYRNLFSAIQPSDLLEIDLDYEFDLKEENNDIILS